MRGKSMTEGRSLMHSAATCLAIWTQLKRGRRLVRPLAASFLALLLAMGPALAQNPPQQNPPKRPQPQPPAPSPASQAYTPAATTPPIPVSLGLSKYNYTRSPRAFPNIIAPYRAIHVPDLSLTNTPRIEQLIHDNKLDLSLQDAVELALENSMDIVIARYNPWFAETDILAAKAGGLPQGATGEEVRFSFANIPSPNFDPTLISTLAYDDRTTPVNNPLISGTGAQTISAAPFFSHTAQSNTQLTQGFSTGTIASVSWNNTRASTSSTFNFFNPDISSSLVVSLQQQLLNGFGRFANRRNIIIAQNNRKLTDYVFEQQAITTITNTITAYWELVYAREAVTVQQSAVTVSEKLYNDNRKQLEIGTMAPLDVTRAEAQLAGDRQNLIIAQTTQLQDQQTLKNAISRNPLAPNLINVEIIPTDKPTPPPPVEAATFEDAVKEAFAKRPELLEQEINIKNAAIDVRATGIALRPTASLFLQYTSQGLSGVSNITGAQTTIAGAPIVDANGNPIPGEFEPITFSPVTGRNHLGFTDAQSQIFHNKFPDYLAALTLTIPLRNRLNQATSQRAILQYRQIQAQMQQLKNTATVDVHNAYIALTQDRAQVEAASKARQLQQQTFEAEQKRYQLGASTVYNVILTQRDFVQAEGNELRALANLLEAKAQYERAVARTLEVNRVSIADAKHGEIERETLIPGTLHGKVVGTEELFSGHR